MKWEKCELIAKTSGDAFDELGNAVKMETVIKTAFCRTAAVTDRDLALYGRTVSDKTLKLLLRCSAADLEQCSMIKFKGIKYNLIETEPSARFPVAFCEKKGKN